MAKRKLARKKVVMSHDMSIAADILKYTIELLIEHIRHDPRARSTYERYVSSTLIGFAENNIREAEGTNLFDRNR